MLEHLKQGENLDLKFGLAVPSNYWNLSLSEKQKASAAIYDGGFDHLFMADHVSFRNGSGTDGFVDVAALSQLHEELGVMISIYLLPLRHPLPVARQLATMSKIAPGRFIFGVGIGGEDRHETEVCGVDPRTRGKRTNESLTIIRRLLDGETVDFQGEHFDISAAKIRPAPDPQIPFIIGGRSDAALRRTALHGEGWIATWCSTRRFREALEIIHTEAEDAGRIGVPWLHGYQPWVGLGTDEKSAYQAVSSQMEAFYKVPFKNFERYTPYGSPEQVAQQLLQFADAGCRLFNIKVCTPKPEDEVEMGAALVAAMSAHQGS